MGASILVVEDEPNIVDSLSFLFKQAGYTVHVARDGDSALRMIPAVLPDLVVLDVMLPRRDGHEVCREIRADPRCQEIRVLMLTAKGQELDRLKGLESGADDYVRKPFSNRQIIDRVKALLDGRDQPDGVAGMRGPQE